MEKRGLGTKATRHAIIERLIEVNYAEEMEKGKAIARPARGRAVIDVLTHYAPRITTPDMTAELEAEMDDIANGRIKRTDVVNALPRAARQGDGRPAPADRGGRRDAQGRRRRRREGRHCPKSGHDLLVKSSAKTKGQFVGCAGWPECDVTYPLPQGKIEAAEEACPVCGTPQVTVIQFRSKPRTMCLDPLCETNREPEIVVGTCAKCAAEGREGSSRCASLRARSSASCAAPTTTNAA
jgi:DNA topoisomerase I